MTVRRLKVRRIYDDREPGDGYRVLVDRLWPRGISKERAALDEWCKQVAPTSELRTWYGHDPQRFGEFARRYRKELHDGEAKVAVAHLRKVARQRNLTLLTATRDLDISGASVLAEVLHS